MTPKQVQEGGYQGAAQKVRQISGAGQTGKNLKITAGRGVETREPEIADSEQEAHQADYPAMAQKALQETCFPMRRI